MGYRGSHTFFCSLIAAIVVDLGRRIPKVEVICTRSRLLATTFGILNRIRTAGVRDSDRCQ